MITTVDGLRYGQLVLSIAGRDQNNLYLILSLINDRFIEVADGIKHRVANPKKRI